MQPFIVTDDFRRSFLLFQKDQFVRPDGVLFHRLAEVFPVHRTHFEEHALDNLVRRNSSGEPPIQRSQFMMERFHLSFLPVRQCDILTVIRRLDLGRHLAALFLLAASLSFFILSSSDISSQSRTFTFIRSPPPMSEQIFRLANYVENRNSTSWYFRPSPPLRLAVSPALLASPAARPGDRHGRSSSDTTQAV